MDFFCNNYNSFSGLRDIIPAPEYDHNMFCLCNINSNIIANFSIEQHWTAAFHNRQKIYISLVLNCLKKD